MTHAGSWDLPTIMLKYSPNTIIIYVLETTGHYYNFNCNGYSVSDYEKGHIHYGVTWQSTPMIS